MKRRGTTPTITTLQTSDETWRNYAHCRPEDDDVFFPASSSGINEPLVAIAKAICSSCPVETTCRQWAIDNRIEFGVYGGLDENERRHQLRRTGDIKTRGGGRTPAPCGTRAAYDRHLRKGEPIDRLCATQGRYSKPLTGTDKDMAA